MGSSISTPPPAPAPIDPGKSALDYMNAMADPALQEKILQSEQTYRPQYAALNLADLNSYLRGTGGQPGALEQSRIATESQNANQIAALSAQRGADIADVEQYGTRASDAFLNANPQLRASLERADALAGPQQNQYSNLLSAQLAQQPSRENIYAQQVRAAQMGGPQQVGYSGINAAGIGQSALGAGLQQGGMDQLYASQGEQGLNQAGLEILNRKAGASAMQTRNAVQQARIASQARGRSGDMSSTYGEISARLAADLDLESRNLGLGSQLLNQGFGMGQQRLGMAGNIYGQDLNRSQSNASMQQQAALANQQALMNAQQLNQAAGLTVGQANQQAMMQAQLANQQANLGASESNRANAQQQYQNYIQNLGQGSQLFNQGLAADRGYAMGLVGARQATASDPFQAILGRGSNASQMGMAQQQFAQGMAGQQGPQLFDPNAGINLALQQNSNLGNYNASTYGARAGAQGAIVGGLFQGLGAIGGGIAAGCWVAREVFGEDNPKWLYFRAWLYTKAPKWFLKLYLKHGEQFAAFIKNKPVLKSVIRMWMNGRIQKTSQLNLA